MEQTNGPNDLLIPLSPPIFSCLETSVEAIPNEETANLGSSFCCFFSLPLFEISLVCKQDPIKEDRNDCFCFIMSLAMQKVNILCLEGHEGLYSSHMSLSIKAKCN